VLVASGGVIISLLSAALLVVFRRRRILAEQLSRALDEQHAIQDNAVVGMVLVVNRIIMRSNRGIEDLLGYPPGGLIGQPTRCFFKSEDDYNALGEAYRAIRKGERWQNEWQLVRSDGSTIWCMMHGKAIDPSHYDKGSVWVIHDISARRQAEAALVDANNRLERSLAEVEQQKANVQEAHDDLAAVIAKLQRAQANLIFSEKMASLGSLVAGIAHELNTPIGNSLLAATALADRVTEFEQVVQAGTFRRSLLLAHLDDTRAACTLLAGSLHKAAHLISSFKQVAVDQTSDDRRHFDLRSVLQDTMATYAVQLKRRNCEATLDAPSAVTMDSYPGSIGQIFNNLIGNSLLHAFEGHNNAIIHISVREIDAGHIEITFQDNGAGMEADTLHRIFDPFFTTKMGQGGSGLGMNIVYNIVTGMLGGAIRVDSTLGQGSTITITIPKVAPSNPPPAKAALF
jgi:PAS domain S-box-containing protein